MLTKKLLTQKFHNNICKQILSSKPDKNPTNSGFKCSPPNFDDKTPNSDVHGLHYSEYRIVLE